MRQFAVHREARRGDRPPGTTVTIREWVPNDVDLEIDTAATPAVDAARRVVDRLHPLAARPAGP